VGKSGDRGSSSDASPTADAGQSASSGPDASSGVSPLFGEPPRLDAKLLDGLDNAHGFHPFANDIDVTSGFNLGHDPGTDGGSPPGQDGDGGDTFTPGEADDGVVPITGDSSSTEAQIQADPGLGERGDGGSEPLDPTDPANATFAPISSPPVEATGSTTAPWLIPAVVAGVVLLGAVGFAATRGSTEPSSPPVPVLTAAPAVATVPAAAPVATAAVTGAPIAAPPNANVQLTLTPIAGAGGVGPFGPKCPHPWSLMATIKVTGAQPGENVHLVLTGPDLPPDATGALDTNLTWTTQTWTVPGTGRWTARVDTVGGRAAGSSLPLNTETCN
jgi:hypothetical protein